MKTAFRKGVCIMVIRIRSGSGAEKKNRCGKPIATPRCTCCTVPVPSSLGPLGYYPHFILLQPSPLTKVRKW